MDDFSLYSLARWSNGLAFRDIHFSPVGLPVIKIAELKEGVSGQTRYTLQTFDDRVFVQNGDMLFSWSGNPDTSIDVFWWRGSDGWLNQHIFKVEPNDEVDKTYFYYLLKYHKPIFTSIARNKQTTGLGHVTVQDLKRLRTPLPSLPEQRAIAAVLGALDDKIELNRRMNATLEAMARALFTSWFVDFNPVRAKMEGRAPSGMDADTAALFPDAFVDSLIGPIPQGWHVMPLPDVITFNPSRTLRKDEVAPYLDMQNMPTRGHRAINWADRGFGSGMKFINGDTLLARITPCLENGKTAFVDFLLEGQVGWGSTEYIVLRPKPPIPAEYGYFLARNDEFRAYAIQSMTGSSGRQRVPASCFDRYLLAVPPEPIARRFGETARPLMSKIRANSEQSYTLAAIRDALLPKLLSGAVRVRDAARAVEAAV